MKYLLSLVAGLLVGAAIAAAFILVNPFADSSTLSPLEVSDRPQLTLSYSLVPADAIVHTNNGESHGEPTPGKVQQLWEPAIRNTGVTVTTMSGATGKMRAIGIKFASLSESTRLLRNEAMIDSVWHVYMPERGTFVVGQRENRFDYLRTVVLPAMWSSSKRWRGSWRGHVTAGPESLGTGRFTGGSGEFSGLEADVIESHTVRAYSAESGPMAKEGVLLVELPAVVEAAVDLPQ